MPLGILEDNASITTTLEFDLLIEGSHEMFSHDLDLYAVSLGKILYREALTSEKLIGDVCENGVVQEGSGVERNGWSSHHVWFTFRA
ncbi:MAG: hypothetical protein ACO39F_06990 [Candidatus Nanopelagicaceae bacterium]